MNLFADIESRLQAHILEQFPADKAGHPLPLDAVTVEAPRDPAHGDMATNAAMVLCKPLGLPPRKIAESLEAGLREMDFIDSVEIAGPGFINMRLSSKARESVLQAVLARGEEYGRADLGQGQAINIEYVSANPTGPMHVGHCRGAVFGDALANLKAFCGYDVTREYYINDAGAQVDVLARSAFLRYREALGEEIGAIPSGLYPGDYLKPVGEALRRDYEDTLLSMNEKRWLPLVKQAALEAMMEMIREDLASLNIYHDVFFSELSLQEGSHNKIQEALALLKDRNLIYKGKLEPPKGKLPDDWENREQMLFRSTAFGDDSDRALMKSDGSVTYFASDIAYHYDKIRRGFHHMVNVWGADHGGYVARMKAAVKALSDEKAKLEVQLCQLVKLTRGGEPVKMSKRSGDFVTLRDVVDEVGRDAVRFMMLYRKNDAPLDFDFQKVTEQSRDNPVFYVQYAHARCHSMFRQAESQGFTFADKALSEHDFSLLADEGEKALILRLASWPRLIEAAGKTDEPHRIAFYLYELASDLHSQWNRGKDYPELRFINHDDPTLTGVRLSLAKAVQKVLSSGLKILGVSAPEEMR
jgi:arginyl-tRNA synthetase